MPLETEHNVVYYDGNDVTTEFEYDYLVLVSSHLKVYVDGLLKTEDLDYVVSGIGNAEGGTVTFIDGYIPPTGNSNVVIERDVPITQLTTYPEASKFPSGQVASDLDWRCMVEQQINERQSRSITFSVTAVDGTQDFEFTENAEARAGRYIGFDDDGDFVMSAPLEVGEVAFTAFGETWVNLESAESAREELGLDSLYPAAQAHDNDKLNIYSNGYVNIHPSDNSNAAIIYPLIVDHRVSNSAVSNGVGVGMLYQTKALVGNTQDVAATAAEFSDVGNSSQDSIWSILLRVAGNALTKAFTFAATTTNRVQIQHGATGTRFQTLPDANGTFVLVDGDGELIPSGSGASIGLQTPSSTGSGSTVAHEGDVTISSPQNYSGIHFCTNFTLNSGVTITVPAGGKRLIIFAKDTITINGTINGVGGGASSPGASAAVGLIGTDQPGGGGGGSDVGGAQSGGGGGNTYIHGIPYGAGGAGGGIATVGGSASSITGHSVIILADATSSMGGASGGGGATDGVVIGVGGAGGAGGATIVLIAPRVVLANGSIINSSGAQGGNADNGESGGGGGGGAGNILIFTASYTDNGCTFTMNGGAGGSAVNGAAGGAGAAGVKQINIY